MTEPVQFIDFRTFMGTVTFTSTDTYAQKAVKIVAAFETFINAKLQIIVNQITAYTTTHANYESISDLNTQYTTENNELTQNVKKTSGDVLTNNRKTYYKDQQKTTLDNYYYYLWIAYIVVLGYFGVRMVYAATYTLSKVALFLVLLFLPFLSTYVLYIVGIALHLAKKYITP